MAFGIIVWQDEQRSDRLKELFDQHLSAAKIAVQLNAEFRTSFTRNAIIGRLHRLGLRRGPSPKLIAVPKSRVKRERKATEPPRPRAKGEAPRPPRPFTPRIVEIIPRNLALIDLAKGDCRYECTKADSAADFRFCGHPVQPGSSFCRHHHAICYVRAQLRQKIGKAWAA